MSSYYKNQYAIYPAIRNTSFYKNQYAIYPAIRNTSFWKRKKERKKETPKQDSILIFDRNFGEQLIFCVWK